MAKLKNILTKKIDNTLNPEEREFTIKDVTPEIYDQLRDEWYRSFDFMKLYQTAPEAGFERFLPYVSVGLSVIILILTIRG